MKSKTTFLVAFILFINIHLFGQDQKTIKVACIGNSITYGSGIKDRIKDSYPAQLGRMLGDGY
ncbi:MAG: sialate O-acetylesterase, partial [Cyclobacteriaceae bacterium]|nr:sialate O-acetylesterase [Cyclobacteriaceae bacterium]